MAFMAFMTIIFMFPTSPGANVTSMNYTVVVLLLLSLAWYYFPVYGGVHWFTGPVPNIDREHKEAGSDATSVDRNAIGETSVAEVV